MTYLTSFPSEELAPPAVYLKMPNSSHTPNAFEWKLQYDIIHTAVNKNDCEARIKQLTSVSGTSVTPHAARAYFVAKN